MPRSCYPPLRCHNFNLQALQGFIFLLLSVLCVITPQHRRRRDRAARNNCGNHLQPIELAADKIRPLAAGCRTRTTSLSHCIHIRRDGVDLRCVSPEALLFGYSLLRNASHFCRACSCLALARFLLEKVAEHLKMTPGTLVDCKDVCEVASRAQIRDSDHK